MTISTFPRSPFCSESIAVKINTEGITRKRNYENNYYKIATMSSAKKNENEKRILLLLLLLPI